MKKIKVISIITTIGIMALIFFFSSQTSEESAVVSSGIVRLIVEGLLKIAPVFEADKEQYICVLRDCIRTLAHFTVFGFLGISVMTMFCSNLNKSRIITGIISLLFCFLYACSDEIHQIFVPGRAFQISDIIVDISGSTVGILSVFLFGIIYAGLKKRGSKV